MNHTTFRDKWEFAESNGFDIESLLRRKFIGSVSVERSSKNDDLHGTDYWVELANGQRISIDAKTRDKDVGKDDVALETWSDVEREVPGWTRDVKKRTDFVLFFWKPTQRYWIVAFQPLLAVFTKNWEIWKKLYQCDHQNSVAADGSSWESECVFVPRKVVERATKLWSGDFTPDDDDGEP